MFSKRSSKVSWTEGACNGPEKLREVEQKPDLLTPNSKVFLTKESGPFFLLFSEDLGALVRQLVRMSMKCLVPRPVLSEMLHDFNTTPSEMD